jgi:NAD(P)-dependent dehydrogenase (short-subunit alcohol dehydrogenase family)
MYDLNGRVAIVTGAAGAIGSETARALAAAGARLVVTDLPGTSVDEVAASLREGGTQAIAHQGDVTEEAAVKDLMRATHEAFGRLDVLDNNAGATNLVPQDHPVTELDAEIWDRMLAVNARGAMLTCKHGIPLMLENEKGVIVNISSGKSLAGDRDGVAYAAGKSALNSLTRYVAAAYGRRGIRCNAIAPGLVLTPASAEAFPVALLEVIEQNSLVGGLGRPEDIASAVLFLCSDASSYICGEVIAVDGGFCSHQPHLAAFDALLGFS